MSVSSEPNPVMNPPYPLHCSVVDKLSPQYKDYYYQYIANIQQAHYQPIEISRISGKITPSCSDPLPVGRTEDFLIPRQETAGSDIKARCYFPGGEAPVKGWGVMVYYHGGGWVFGDIDTEKTVCTNLCVRANCAVITVDYRLAPEYPFPAAVYDCWEAFLWITSTGARILNLDLGKVAIGGSSAGANLAAVMTQKALSRSNTGGRIDLKLQLLVVPVTDNTATTETNATWRTLENTAALPAAKMLWYRNHYLPDPVTRSHPDASPLLFRGDFGKLPSAVILVGEVDVVRHEGEEYARKLQDAGADVRLEVMPGMPHSFLALDAVLDEGRRAITILCEALVGAFR